jgi:hypothetical protein
VEICLYAELGVRQFHVAYLAALVRAAIRQNDNYCRPNLLRSRANPQPSHEFKVFFEMYNLSAPDDEAGAPGAGSGPGGAGGVECVPADKIVPDNGAKPRHVSECSAPSPLPT